MRKKKGIINDTSQPPPDLAERNRLAFEARGMNAELFFTFHNEQVIRIKHYEDGLFCHPRYVRRRDVDDEHWMILYEAENGAEYVSTLSDFFGYVDMEGERVGRFKVVDTAPPQRRRAPPRAK